MRVEGDDDPTDPSFSTLSRNGDRLLLSSHSGDGELGQVIVVTTDDVDALFRKFRQRGLRTPGKPDAPQHVHECPIDQSWARGSSTTPMATHSGSPSMANGDTA